MQVLKRLMAVIWLFSFMFIIGCATTMPQPPKGAYKSVREIIVTPVSLDSNVDSSLKITKNQTVAIMSFKEPEGSGSGYLVADAFILDIQRKGYKVIEREHIERLMREQGLIGEGKTKLTDIEIAKKLGRLLAADYFVFGAVTEYRSENREITVSKKFSQEEIESYKAEYNKYNENCRLRALMGVVCLPIKSVDQIIEESIGRREFARVANVGLTAKMVEISTSKIVWVGQASLTDEKLQDGMKRIVEAMVKDFLKL